MCNNFSLFDFALFCRGRINTLWSVLYPFISSNNTPIMDFTTYMLSSNAFVSCNAAYTVLKYLYYYDYNLLICYLCLCRLFKKCIKRANTAIDIVFDDCWFSTLPVVWLLICTWSLFHTYTKLLLMFDSSCCYIN